MSGADSLFFEDFFPTSRLVGSDLCRKIKNGLPHALFIEGEANQELWHDYVLVKLLQVLRDSYRFRGTLIGFWDFGVGGDFTLPPISPELMESGEDDTMQFTLECLQTKEMSSEDRECLEKVWRQILSAGVVAFQFTCSFWGHKNFYLRGTIELLIAKSKKAPTAHQS